MTDNFDAQDVTNAWLNGNRKDALEMIQNMPSAEAMVCGFAITDHLSEAEAERFMLWLVDQL